MKIETLKIKSAKSLKFGLTIMIQRSGVFIDFALGKIVWVIGFYK